ncbi:WD40 repeat-like protein [Microthyrium microscopicum]|uniref:Elongator complex protein 2 n=1 Tax=Microthyrium microscopicum TaxID=703497 RepID=A0A6A6UCM9_9PEZI|nr:WD40 repeat-like protein [Microthyrium microscopicum]
MGDRAELEYISIGGNRHPSAADWANNDGGCLAYGAGNSIALWRPLDSAYKGVYALLNGHTDAANAVKFYQRSGNQEVLLFSGSVDKSIRAWRVPLGESEGKSYESAVVAQHDASVTALEILSDSQTLISASADSTIKVWDLSHFATDGINEEVELVETIKVKIMPLAISAHDLDKKHKILAVAGSNAAIHIYVTQTTGKFGPIATLTGHAGWIRSLSFVRETTDTSSDLLLASASQDKFIRLWRIHKGEELPSSKAVDDPSLGLMGKSVSTKAHRFEIGDERASITFEALLLGHDDWIYSNKWHHHDGKLQLLSASADNSLAIWEADANSGIWVCVSRLGEISAQKGSTTATGSTGGFWIGLWSPKGNAVASLGRTGGWRLWQQESEHIWVPQIGCGGHVRSVTDIAWSKSGGYLLSTSSDQTSRLHSKWKQTPSWHEFARPQIHGYDLNCIGVISDTQFVSGADEKPLRVFQEPAVVASLLSKLCDISQENTDLPDAANIPVLGLSNKAIQAVDDKESNTNGDTEEPTTDDPSFIVNISALDIDHPPVEDQLARHLLWPEIHKVYGHGYEISAVAVTQDGTLMATACRASSIDHAVIRVYDTKDWKDFSEPLRAHSLTVTSLQWSPDGGYLLSVGRDRIWSIFELIDGKFTTTTAKGHSRMILDCSWAPLEAGRIFATAGRDKSVKIWQLIGTEWQLKSTITVSQPATAVAFAPSLPQNHLSLAIGLESGELLLAEVSMEDLEKVNVRPMQMQLCPHKGISRIAWQPQSGEQASGLMAVASEDGSLRIFTVPS